MRARQGRDLVWRVAMLDVWSAGQGLVEYGLILALTALFTVIILGVFGGTVSDLLSLIANAIDAATGS
jgi:Flp pilus assembly pilin Flp